MIPLTKRTRDHDRSKCPPREVWSSILECETAEPRFLEHLESCAICRAALEESAGQADVWHTAVDSLSTPCPDLSRLSRSICPFAEQASFDRHRHELCDHEVHSLQQLLRAPSHPELLARIGRYELEQLVGRGGMGLVFRAHDTELHRVVAVKTLAMHLLPISAARERFVREGRASAGLSHPNIVPTYDVIPDQGVPALVMQYIAGPTLEHHVQRNGPLSLHDVCRLGAQIADALSAAHAQSLVHRDLKPANVLLEADGARALLTDFGLVRALHDATLTASGSLAGTPHCMAPEQIRGKEVDCRADLFALGTVLYFMATGKYPFDGAEPMSVLHAICHDRHIPLLKLNPTMPRSLSSVVDRLLAKDPAQRFVSAAEVRDVLRGLIAPKLNTSHFWKGPRLAAVAVVAVIAVLIGGWTVSPWLLNGLNSNADRHAQSSSGGKPTRSNKGVEAFSSNQAGHGHSHGHDHSNGEAVLSSSAGAFETAGDFSTTVDAMIGLREGDELSLRQIFDVARDLESITQNLFSDFPPAWDESRDSEVQDATSETNALLDQLRMIEEQAATPFQVSIR